MYGTKPDEALAMLIKARGSSTSTASDSDVGAKVKHDALIFKFTREYIQRDAFKALQSNPKAIYSMKAFLGELRTPITSEPMLHVITQVE
ncbi:protein gar2-like [Trifolium medium]|uniref:Protein gar2-like n=1 Tax=Trifolium medium TaxID=97028 RepID=A0A392NMZ1_9FABA|nr:protein gar2-like [Trifolium medium]